MGIEDWTGKVHQGEVRNVLSDAPEKSIDCCVASPPFYGLRDYGEEDQIGLEDTPGEYVQNMVEVGRSVQRVLKDTGTWWLNLGDTYAGGGGISGVPDDWDSASTTNREKYPESVPARDTEFKDKTKLLIPHRVAISLIDDGWICRNDAVWAKPNPMPESVTDRLSTTFEYFFLFSKKKQYYFDLDAIREPHKTDYSGYDGGNDNIEGTWSSEGIPRHRARGVGSPVGVNILGKNPGDVFEVTTQPFPDAHFAVYPPELIETPIKASCPSKVCANCQSPYERQTEVVKREVAGGVSRVPEDERGYADRQGKSQNDREGLTQSTKKTVGWEKTCDCDTEETEPGIVLDPFMGSGTTAVVAENLGRRWVGIDLNKDYVEMSEDRISTETDFNVNPISEW